MRKWVAIWVAASLLGAGIAYADDYVSGFVVGIQGVPVVPQPPKFGQILIYNSKQNRYIPGDGSALPTACGVLPTGTLWNSSGTVSVCP